MKIVLETCKTKDGKFRVVITIHNAPGGFGASPGPLEFASEDEVWAYVRRHAETQKAGPWQPCDANKN